MTWEELGEKYQVPFKLADGQWRPVNEWLDDVYLRLTPETLSELMNDLERHALDLFGDLKSHKK